MTEVTAAVKPLLVFSYGNPARGDDALGPLLTDRLSEWLAQYMPRNPLGEQVEILTDYQLQIEHATDLQGRNKVIFVDASVSCQSPHRLHELQPEQDSSYTTHALQPPALLQVYQQIYQQPPPPCYLLEIRGYQFELGATLSGGADANLASAVAFMKQQLPEYV